MAGITISLTQLVGDIETIVRIRLAMSEAGILSGDWAAALVSLLAIEPGEMQVTAIALSRTTSLMAKAAVRSPALLDE